MKDSLITGFTTGAAVGAAGGVAVNKKDRGKSAAIGAITGGVLGLIISNYTHSHLKKRDAKIRRSTLFNLDKYDVAAPKNHHIKGEHGITMPVIDSDYIEEHTSSDGKKLIEGHRVWIIKEDSQWTPKKK